MGKPANVTSAQAIFQQERDVDMNRVGRRRCPELRKSDTRIFSYCGLTITSHACHGDLVLREACSSSAGLQSYHDCLLCCGVHLGQSAGGRDGDSGMRESVTDKPKHLVWGISTMISQVRCMKDSLHLGAGAPPVLGIKDRAIVSRLCSWWASNSRVSPKSGPSTVAYS